MKPRYYTHGIRIPRWFYALLYGQPLFVSQHTTAGEDWQYGWLTRGKGEIR